MLFGIALRRCTHCVGVIGRTHEQLLERLYARRSAEPVPSMGLLWWKEGWRGGNRPPRDG